MLKFLKFDGCCDVATLNDGKTFVKIVDKRQTTSSAAFTQQVYFKKNIFFVRFECKGPCFSLKMALISRILEKYRTKF